MCGKEKQHHKIVPDACLLCNKGASNEAMVQIIQRPDSPQSRSASQASDGSDRLVFVTQRLRWFLELSGQSLQRGLD